MRYVRGGAVRLQHICNNFLRAFTLHDLKPFTQLAIREDLDTFLMLFSKDIA